MLVKKWIPHGNDFAGDPIMQVVVPAKYRSLVLKISHDKLAGHLGVKKPMTESFVFFGGPKLKKDVLKYIKTCHNCQLTGKPNQKIKPAPLFPIPAVSPPFEHLIIDCVGPLPISKSGRIYLLTLMCASTRYPCGLFPPYDHCNFSGESPDTVRFCFWHSKDCAEWSRF